MHGSAAKILNSPLPDTAYIICLPSGAIFANDGTIEPPIRIWFDRLSLTVRRNVRISMQLCEIGETELKGETWIHIFDRHCPCAHHLPPEDHAPHIVQRAAVHRRPIRESASSSTAPRARLKEGRLRISHRRAAEPDTEAPVTEPAGEAPAETGAGVETDPAEQTPAGTDTGTTGEVPPADG